MTDPAATSAVDRKSRHSYHRAYGNLGNTRILSVEDNDISITRLLREIPNPRFEVEATDFGSRIYALRDGGDFMHVRVTNHLFPNGAVVAIGDWSLVQLHVPIDDENNWRYDIFYSFGEPMDHETLMRERFNTYNLPAYEPKRNRTNRYGFDAAEQRTGTFAGVGYDFNIHDTMILYQVSLIKTHEPSRAFRWT